MRVFQKIDCPKFNERVLDTQLYLGMLYELAPLQCATATFHQLLDVHSQMYGLKFAPPNADQARQFERTVRQALDYIMRSQEPVMHSNGGSHGDEPRHVLGPRDKGRGMHMRIANWKGGDMCRYRVEAIMEACEEGASLGAAQLAAAQQQQVRRQSQGSSHSGGGGGGIYAQVAPSALARLYSTAPAHPLHPRRRVPTPTTTTTTCRRCEEGSAGHSRIPRAAPASATAASSTGGGGATSPVRAPLTVASATSLSCGRRRGPAQPAAQATASASRLARAAARNAAAAVAAAATPLVPTFALPVLAQPPFAPATLPAALLTPSARLGGHFAAVAAAAPPSSPTTTSSTPTVTPAPGSPIAAAAASRSSLPVVHVSLPVVTNTNSVESLPDWFSMMAGESKENLSTVEEEEQSTVDEEQEEEQDGDAKSAEDSGELVVNIPDLTTSLAALRKKLCCL
ncbi:hypothetical protein PRIPAC_70559 [Pristionchus pacificus]|uniref:Uncharacterized protein n=1 Tax=Pristionchus pacificus TaxID=54126 RepID=A0A2A6C0T1_PRIPA|nr:hypothetical protein PRIPAC_70559 [Pristionchus pacificus]|eukprot:PDM71862.1 hypothetical protein PRIPAC_38269 [Pristionchus pacificus]